MRGARGFGPRAGGFFFSAARNRLYLAMHTEEEKVVLLRGFLGRVEGLAHLWRSSEEAAKAGCRGLKADIEAALGGPYPWTAYELEWVSDAARCLERHAMMLEGTAHGLYPGKVRGDDLSDEIAAAEGALLYVLEPD